jgi:drug/metabolite transporter (DMT)-like permease
MRPAILAHLLLLAVVIVWGATFVLIKDALANVSPLLFVLLRMALAALVLALVYRRELRSVGSAALGMGALVGICLGAGYALQTTGLRLTTASKSAFLTGLVVVMVPGLSLIPALRAPGAHRPRWTAGLGAMLAFAGLLLLTLPAGEPLVGVSLFSGFGRGELLTLGCAFAYALHMLALAHAAPRLPYTQLAVVQIAVAALTLAVAMPFFEPHPFFRPVPSVIGALAIASLLATAAAFTIQSWAQQFLPATHTALILTLEPVFAFLTSFLLLGERLGARSGGGALLILTGIAITELWPERIQATAHESAPMV